MFAPNRLALAGSVLVALCAAAPAQAAEPQQVRPEDRIVELTNQARAAAGCRPLAVDPGLGRFAEGHAGDMARRDYFAHSAEFGGQRSGGLLGLLRGSGTSRAAENIAAGKPTPEAVFQQWISSDGHRRNIEDCRYTSVGVGHAFSAASRYGHYWVQEFAG